MKNTCPFSLTEKVLIDGDPSIIGVVIAVMFETTGSSVKVSWVHSGAIHREWIDEWRLTKWEG